MPQQALDMSTGMAQGGGVLGTFRSRLSQRIVLSVFTAIVAIEALILVPSVYRREQEQLDHLSELSAASLLGAMGEAKMAVDSLPPDQLLGWLSRATAIPEVLGGRLYRQDGTEVGSFGEAPTLTFGQMKQVQGAFRGSHLDRRQRRYDAPWAMSPLDGKYLLIVRHDTSGVRRELFQFVGRIFWLVVLISVVVTLATMVVLRSILIKPILALRNDLLRAAPAALQGNGAILPRFSAVAYQQDDELGEVIAAFGQMFGRIAGAIAERQQAEMDLRASETKFRTLVDQATESIFVVDQQARIIDANQFAQACLGYSREELLQFHLWDINADFDPSQFQPLWERLRSGEPITLESRHRCKGGETFPVEVRIGLIESDGETRLLGLARDITARKLAEQAQARLAEIGELAAMIVHEVRNPLATVYMALTGFKRLALPQGGELRLALALEESERLQRLLNEILAYAKEQKLAGETIEVGDLVEEVRRSLQALPVAAGRKIVVTAEGGAVEVVGDRDKLKQVFINLVTNACEAIAPGEVVTWMLEPQPDNWLRVQVHNGGEPIPPEVLPKLTQPFVSTKAGGNGLGLAITKRIVEAHGGSLAIASDGAGTCVTVLLPRSVGGLGGGGLGGVRSRPGQLPRPTALANRPGKPTSQRPPPPAAMVDLQWPSILSPTLAAAAPPRPRLAPCPSAPAPKPLHRLARTGWANWN